MNLALPLPRLRVQRDSLKAGVVGGLLVVAIGVAQLQAPLAGGPAAMGGRSASIALDRPKLAAPPVEPLELREITRTDAVEINAAVPFSTAPNPAARPFIIKDKVALARSIDCLAAAVHYEAAVEGADGQRAVAQVVLNRLRHPAYPKSVCGVVFQGSERSTGCQFTFTCDGAMTRTPSADRWRQARAIATAALAGKVHKPVGMSTHYHTNWVVPYWSASLDKVTAVGTHLFFRWTGWWGTPGAFRGGYAGAEPTVAQLAGLSPAHAPDPTQLAAAPTAAAAAAAAAALAARGAKQVKIVSSGGDAFVVVLDKKAEAASYPSLALAACGDKDFCKFMGWTDPAKAPTGFPIDPMQHEALSFSYLRNRSNGFEKMLWNCKEFKGREEAQCMKG